MKHVFCLTLALLLVLTGCGRVATGTEEGVGSPGGASSQALPPEVSSGVAPEAGSGAAPEISAPQPEIPQPEVTVTPSVEENRTDGSGTVLLRFSYNTAAVSIPGYEGAAEAIQRELDGWVETLKARAEELETVRGEDEFFDGEYYLEGELTVTREDSGIISVQIRQSEYAGGAHGSTCCYGITYDTATGQRLTLATLGEGVRGAAVQRCQALAQLVEEKREGFFFEGYLDGVSSSVVTDTTFWMTEGGVLFVDNEYVLQPYAGGTLYFYLPYSDLREVMDERYLLPGAGGDAASVTLFSTDVYTLE